MRPGPFIAVGPVTVLVGLVIAGADAVGQAPQRDAPLARAARPDTEARPAPPRRADRPARRRDSQPRPGPPAAEPVPASAPNAGLPGGEEAGDLPTAGTAANAIGRALSSPQCRTSRLRAAERANCRASGTPQQTAPLDNYGLDVHIKTGLTRIRRNIHSAFHELVISPLWNALLYLLRAVLWLLEWAFGVNLLGSEQMPIIGRTLARAQRLFSTPWMTTALAAAGAWVLYNGIARQRVARTAGGVAVMAAMMLAGLWLIRSPAYSVGWANGISNQAGLGTLAAINNGNPSEPTAGYARALRGVFESTVSPSWCMLEFGDPGWCLAPADPRLRAQAREAIAKWKEAVDQPPFNSALPDELDGLSRAEAHRALGITVAETALRRARTNGQVFLAFPVNSAPRNGNSDWTLHRWLVKHQPELKDIKNERGTVMRFALVVVVVVGLLGAVVMLGWLAVNLVIASVLVVFWLVLAPVFVLAPAFGETGREVFKLYARRLISALAAKLIFAVYLAATLLCASLIAQLSQSGAGWLGQWVLLAVFWWAAFAKRQETIGLVTGGNQPDGSGFRMLTGVMATREAARAGRALTRATAGRPMGAAREVYGRQRARRTDQQAARTQAVAETARASVDEQAEAMLAHRYTDAKTRTQALEEREGGLREQRQHLRALESLDESLLGPEDRDRHHQTIQQLRAHTADETAQITAERARLSGPARFAQAADERQTATGQRFSDQQREGVARMLRDQARLPAGRRDYARLAAIEGVSAEAYAEADAEQRARIQRRIDQHLDHQRPILEASDPGRSPSSREARRAEDRLARYDQPPPTGRHASAKRQAKRPGRAAIDARARELEHQRRRERHFQAARDRLTPTWRTRRHR